MQILNPVLAPDVSNWTTKIDSRQFEDGGCGSIVVGLYPTSTWELNPVSRAQALDVMTRSNLILQAYMWDDITKDPVRQADWAVDIVQREGLNVKWIWGDQEQWWTDWTAWFSHAPVIPTASPAVISNHNETFMRTLSSRFPLSGVYTNNNFVVSNAWPMNNWLPKYRSWVPHYGRQPREKLVLSWEQLHANWMPNYSIILAAGQQEYLVAGHQFTGDRMVLPGSYDQYGRLRPSDVSAFGREFIDCIRGSAPMPGPVPVPAPQPTRKLACKVLYQRINVRAQASQASAWVRFAVKDEVLYLKSTQVTGGYYEMADGTFVWAGYVSQPILQ